jgi:hypothetical protein
MNIITNLELQNKFNSVTEKSLNRKLLIENEIREIENYVNNIPAYVPAFLKNSKTAITNKSPKIFSFGDTYIDRKIFNEAFYEYLNNGKVISIDRTQIDNDKSYQLKQNSADQSIEVFKYYEWLKIQLTTKAKPSISFNHEEKLLALLYLGMDTKKYDNTKSAKILSVVLGMSEQNTRDHLSYLYQDAINNPVRTKKHLETVFKEFENQGLTEISTRIKDEIKNLK